MQVDQSGVLALMVQNIVWKFMLDVFRPSVASNEDESNVIAFHRTFLRVSYLFMERRYKLGIRSATVVQSQPRRDERPAYARSEDDPIACICG